MEPFLGLDSRSAVCRINADTVRFPAEADTSVRQSNVARRNRRIANQQHTRDCVSTRSVADETKPTPSRLSRPGRKLVSAAMNIA